VFKSYFHERPKKKNNTKCEKILTIMKILIANNNKLNVEGNHVRIAT